MFAAAVSKPEIAQNAFVATKKCKSMPTVVVQYRTLWLSVGVAVSGSQPLAVIKAGTKDS